LKDFPTSKDSGFSLLGAMVALVILGILGWIFSNFAGQSLTIIKRIQDKSQLEDLRQNIRISIDCKRTKLDAPATCPVNTLTVLKRPTGIIYINNTPSNFTKIGKYKVKASCTSIKYQYRVEFQISSGPWNDLFTIPITC
jgi:type II secretory pathway pseudopilin PulG